MILTSHSPRRSFAGSAFVAGSASATGGDVIAVTGIGVARASAASVGVDVAVGGLVLGLLGIICPDRGGPAS